MNGWKANIELLASGMTNSAKALAIQFKMDGIARFKTLGDCLYVEDEDVLKLYRPKARRPVGGSGPSRVLLGEIGFVLRGEIAAGPRSLEEPPSLSLCPLMNFPDVVGASEMTDGKVGSQFISRLWRYFAAIPAGREQIEQSLGSDFLNLSRLERVPRLARHLLKQTET